MKTTIHPQWHDDCQVTCACGATFTTGSTYPNLTVEICGQCHPFFTGEMKFVDTQGRVDRFMQKRQASEAKRAALEAQKAAKAKKNTPADKPAASAKTYRQILADTKGEMKKSTPVVDQKTAATEEK